MDQISSFLGIPSGAFCRGNYKKLFINCFRQIRLQGGGMVDAWWPWKLWSRGSDQREQPTGALVCTKYDSILNLQRIHWTLQNSNSYLWNAMIAPLRRLNLYGFLWYQVGGWVLPLMFLSRGKQIVILRGTSTTAHSPHWSVIKKIKSKYISLQWYFKQTTGGSSSPSLRHLLGIFCTLKFWISL